MPFSLRIESASLRKSDQARRQRLALLAAVEAHAEAAAQGLGYGSAVALASYAGSGVPEWAAEAKRFIKWRDDIWQSAHKALAGRSAPKTAEGLIALLPALPPSQTQA